MTTPRYISREQVIVFLKNKLGLDSRFGDNGITNEEIDTLISFSEADVERDLSEYYITPFTHNGGDWKLASATSVLTLTNMFIIKSMHRLLVTYFGDTSGVKGKTYEETLLKEYNELIIKNTELKTDVTMAKLAPLTGIDINRNSRVYNTYAPSPRIGSTPSSITTDRSNSMTTPEGGVFYGFNLRNRRW